MRIKRRNIAWLSVLGTLTLIAVAGIGINTTASFFLLTALGIAGTISLFDMEPRKLIETVQQRTPIGGPSQTAEAREAAVRAEQRGAYGNDMNLLDVGLIALREDRGGMVMQRTRSLSLDDAGARPYVSMRVPAVEADRHANVRFEMDDGNGETIYQHDQRVFMRDGRMDILADTQMPLFDSDMNVTPGDGDLRVYVDGQLVGVLGYHVAPSTRDRYAGRRSPERARQRLADRERESDSPVSLEDLLRQENRDR